MSWTKRQIITKAFSRLGMAAYTFDIGPDQMEDAMTTLDSMMATWNQKGIRINYPFPGKPENSSLDTETDMPLYVHEAVFCNLALNLASDYGKQIAPQLLGRAKSTYDTLLIRAAQPREMKFPTTLPAGAGNKPWVLNDPFIHDQESNVVQGPDEYPEFLP